jgi:transcriptional regulator with XRE-family HTH domain
MAPFGEAVLLWRLKRGLTQSELARRAGVPRPNLSAIERGQREVSLRTVRALAVALGVRAGVLVDGVLPQEEEGGRLSREAMERIADAVVEKTRLRDAKERALADQLSSLVRARLRAAGHRTKKAARLSRASDRAWLFLSSYPQTVIESLVSRILERGGRR